MTQLTAIDSPSERKTTTLDVLEESAKQAETSGSVLTVPRVHGLHDQPHAERRQQVFIVRSGLDEPASVHVRFQPAVLPLLVTFEGAFRESMHLGFGSVSWLLEFEPSYVGEASFAGEAPDFAAAAELPAPHATSEHADAKDDEVWQEILELLDEEAVTAGEPHPAEPILARLLGTSGFGSGLRRIYDSERDLRRSLVLCMGRLPLSVEQQMEVRAILAEALRDRSVQVREAAVRALETLDSIAGDLLASYDERVPWLRDYADRVLRRLSG